MNTIEFSEILKWISLNSLSEEPTVLLCQNVVDIMRLRILIHEYREPEKSTLFNVQFLTPDLWINKIKSFKNKNEHLISKNLVIKAYIRQASRKALENTTNPYLKALLEKEGFQRELPSFWQMYSWNRNLFFHQDSIVKSKNDFLIDFFKEIENILKENKSVTIPEWVTCEDKQIYDILPGFNQVIAFFPTLFNPLEMAKIDFLKEISHCSWKFVLPNNSVPEETPYFNLSKGEYFLLNFKPRSQEKYKNWQTSNHHFFNMKSEVFENKIWMAGNIHDEMDLIGRSIRNLLDFGVKPHKIFLLYTTPAYTPLLDFAFQKYRIKLNYQEKFSASNRPVVSIALGLIDLMNLRGDNYPVYRNSLIDFVNIPLLNLYPDSIKNKFQQLPGKLIYEHFSITDQIHLEGKNLNKLKHLPPELFTFLKSISNDKTKLNQTHKEVEKIALFWEILKKYFNPEKILSPVYTDELREVDRIIQSISEIIFEVKNIDSESLFDLLFKELTEIKIKPVHFVNDNRDFPEIYARSLSEFVHSPIDYLFIAGLTSRAFPLNNEHPPVISFYENTPSLGLPEDVQIQKLKKSLELVNKGLCITFNLQKDSAPSEAVFEILDIPPDEVFDKNKFLENLPFFNREGKIKIKGLNSGYNDQEKTPLPDKKMISSFHTKIDGTLPDEFKDFSGNFLMVNDEKISSSGYIESVSSCPQYFYFGKILGLKQPVNPKDIKFTGDQVFRGTIFHQFARYWTDYQKEKFPQMPYKLVNKNIKDDEQKKILRELYEMVLDNFVSDYHLDFKKLSHSILDFYFDEFLIYFQKFFYLAENDRHYLSEYHPVGAEIEFSNIDIGEFYLSGKIDKLDYNQNEKTLFITDYKTGNHKNYNAKRKEVLSLRTFQVPLYMRASIELVKRSELQTISETGFIMGGYEFPGNPKLGPKTEFVEFSDGKIKYEFEEVINFFNEMGNNSLSFIHQLIQSGYFFAYGHKKNNDSSEAWESPCSYCDFSKICDRSPFDTMRKRIEQESISKEFSDRFYSVESGK